MTPRSFGVPAMILLSLASSFAMVRTAMAQEGAPGKETISLAEYHHLIADYDRGARHGLTGTEANALRQRFQHILAVTLLDGRLVTVENDREIATLNRAVAARGTWKADAADRARISLLDAMVAGGDALPSRGDPGQQVRAILAMTEFKDAIAPVPPPSAWDRMLARIQKSIGDFLNRLLRRQNTPQTKPVPWLAQFVIYTLYFLAAIGALIGLYYLGRWALERLAKRGDVRARNGFDLSELSLSDPLASSRESAERGDYRGALRLAYLAALQRLSRAGLLILQENRTNWEYQRVLRSRSTLAYDVLLPATRLFDEVWYGGREATLEEYKLVIAAHDALPADAPGSEPKISANASESAPPSAVPTRRNGNPW